MLRDIAQRLIQAFLINNRFLHLLIVKVCMFKLETLNNMLRELWTAGSLVPFSYGSKVPSAAIFALRVITKKVCSIGSQRLAVFKLFPWPYHIAKNLSKKAACHFQKQKNAGTKILHSSFKIKISPQNWINSCSSSKTHTGDKKAISTSLPKPHEHTFTRWRETAYGHWAHPGQRSHIFPTCTLQFL